MKEQMRNDLGLPYPSQANAGPMPGNSHPLNQKAKELLQQIPENPQTECLHSLQLAAWGIYNQPKLQDDDLERAIQVLSFNTPPKHAMIFLLKNKHPELTEFRQAETPIHGSLLLVRLIALRLKDENSELQVNEDLPLITDPVDDLMIRMELI